MNNSENELIRLIEIIRKDTGINNIIDAVEQLSLLLLLKHFESRLETEVGTKDSLGEFDCLSKSLNDLFSVDMFGDNIETTFSTLKKLSSKNIEGSEKNNLRLSKTWRKIEQILNAIPFKVRSDKILQHLLLSLRDVDASDPSLGEHYEELINKMVNDSIYSGAYYSPKPLVTAIVKVINPASGQSIYDPALGTGGFIVESKKYLSTTEGNLFGEPFDATGSDVSPIACLITSLNLQLHGIDIDHISMGDSLLDDDRKRYDIVLSNPPFGKISNMAKYDDASNIEAIFLKTAMQKLAENGKAALIVPDGLLFNRTRGLEGIRQELLTKFNLHSILSLPQGTLAPYTNVKVSVLFFENKEPEKHIWFYKLRRNTPINKSNQIAHSDFAEFIEMFPGREQSSNSCIVDKQDILNSAGITLSIDLPESSYESNDFKVLDEIGGLKKQKAAFDLLLAEYMDSLAEDKQAKVIEKVRIGDLFKTRAGKVLNKSEITENGRFPVYGGNGIIGYYNDYNREGENILIGRVGAHCGNVHFVKGPIWVTDNSFSVQLDFSMRAYLPYLAHVIRSMNLNKLARGSAQPSISYSKIKDLEINLPSYEQQVELSEWFDEIQEHSTTLLELLKLQEEEFSQLSNDFISSKCLKERF